MITSGYFFVKFSNEAPNMYLHIRSIADLSFPFRHLNGTILIKDDAGNVLCELNRDKSNIFFFNGEDLMDRAALFSSARYFYFHLPDDNLYSSRMQIKPCINSSVIRYWNDEPFCGYEYPMGTYCQIRLPILLKTPQLPQEQEVYKDLSGKRTILFAAIEKKYNLSVDFLPVNEHEDVLIALSHDYVEVNGERLTKTGAYDINWPDVINPEVATASCEMSANITIRNSNY